MMTRLDGVYVVGVGLVRIGMRIAVGVEEGEPIVDVGEPKDAKPCMFQC